MKLILKVYDALLTVLITLLILLELILTGCHYKGYDWYVITSDSMYPTIKRGDATLIDTNDRWDVAEGDIVCFRVSATNVTHRIYSVNEDGTYTTKGDANETIDPSNIKKNQIRGTVKFKSSIFGKVLDTFTKIGVKKFSIVSIGLLVVRFVITLFSKN